MGHEQELIGARAGDAQAFERLVDKHRRELLAHCYRMLGSLADAEDALQDTLVRAWRGLDDFEARASLRTWLYRIATHVCLDLAERRGPRTLPTLARPAAAAGDEWMAAVEEPVWIEPLPDARLVAKESVALAFVAVLSRLPPRQRAALLLFDVLGFHAGEVAELLGMSVTAANSTLQRARESVTAEPTARRAPPEVERGLLERYLRAWEEADVQALVSLLAGDARLSMPPFPLWYEGAGAIGAALAGMVLPAAARGRFRGVTTSANGEPAVAVYERDAGGRFLPLAVHVLRISQGKIAEITAFMGPGAFRGFELPAEL